MARASKWLIGWGVILLCYYAGMFISTSLNLPVPGTLVGLVLLLLILFLFSGLDKLVTIAAAPLLKHMSVLFVPAVLGVSLYWHDIQQNGLAIAIAIVVSTAISLGIAGKLAVLFFGKRGHAKDSDQL